MTTSNLNESGQTTLEVAFGITALIVTLTGVGYVLKAEFHRERCAYFTFETTRAKLSGDLGPLQFRVPFSVQVGPMTIQGKGDCEADADGTSPPTEKVEMSQIE